jgi:hypothetical protein
VEIEDRGLGISEERLAELNHRLANPPEFDLSDSDQLGLFVAGRLAQRHGVRISMQNNAYGGSTAIVLMPHSLVVPGDIDLETAFANSGDGGSGRHADGGEALATSNGRTPRPNPESPIGNGTAGKEGARRPSPGVGLDARPNAGGLLDTPLSAAEDPLVGTVPDGTSDSVGRPDFSTSTAQSHDIDWRPPDVSPPPAAGIGTPGLGLPRRIRQANLAPQLRTNAPPPSHAGAEQEAVGDRSPEQTRALMSSLQRGWERGRSAPEIGLGHSESSGYQDGAPTEGENGGR